jgi:hypothetical protein
MRQPELFRCSGALTDSVWWSVLVSGFGMCVIGGAGTRFTLYLTTTAELCIGQSICADCLLKNILMAGTTGNAALSPRPLPTILLGSIIPVATWFVLRPLLDPVPPLPSLYTSVGFSLFALLATLYLVPALGPTFISANLKGRDLLKIYQTPMCVISVDHIYPRSINPALVQRAWV